MRDCKQSRKVMFHQTFMPTSIKISLSQIKVTLSMIINIHICMLQKQKIHIVIVTFVNIYSIFKSLKIS